MTEPEQIEEPEDLEVEHEFLEDEESDDPGLDTLFGEDEDDDDDEEDPE